MGGAMSSLGAAMVILVLRDVFHTLFHPGGQGRISRRALVTTWRAVKWIGGRERLGELAGPLGVVVVIGVWAASVLLGGALVYWPHIPGGFSYASGLDPEQRNGLLDAVYFSLATTTTLGYGDIVPTSGWLRLVAPLQAMIGFSLLTAAVTWVLQVYPALNRRRRLATRLTTMHQAGVHQELPHAQSPVLAMVLESLATDIIQIRTDLLQYAETYFFRVRDQASALPAALPYANDLATVGGKSRRADIRIAASVLSGAVTHLAQLLGSEFLDLRGTTEDILAAYATDHGVTIGLRVPTVGGPAGA